MQVKYLATYAPGESLNRVFVNMHIMPALASYFIANVFKK